jgi:GTP cyclohydrolase I
MIAKATRHHEARLNGRTHAGGSDIDHARIEAAVRELLIAVGEDPDRDGLLDTPRRVARAYGELFGGLHRDPAEHLGRIFEQQCDEVVTVCGIDVLSVCEHHLLPFMGTAHVAYIPDGGRVVGLSKIARTVDVFARRPQIQERLTDQIADAIGSHLDARGVLVMIEAEHLCMKMRGVRAAEASMVTVARRGAFRDEPGRATEVLNLMTARGRSRS